MYYSKKKAGKTILFFILLFAYYMLHTTYYAYAATLTNDTFILEIKDTRPPSLRSGVSGRVNLQPTLSPSPTPEILPKPFSFSVSATAIDFGEITPTDPITRTTTINITPGSIFEFSLFALLDNNLTSENKKIIPDTTCDTGSCNHIYASSWDNILTYGFGWQCNSENGFDCKDNFPKSTYFKQLPNQAKGHVLYPILLGHANKKETQTIITYKTNISPAQDIGLYTNILHLIAVPNF